jgi:AbrB family looped-hinge helix DNA binding protein
MDMAVRMNQHGGLILPAELRRKYGIRAGDAIRVLDFDGIIVLAPITQTVVDLAGEIEHLRLEGRLSTDELLAGLREQRERYYVENYANHS